jgi:hypothetical protein
MHSIVNIILTVKATALPVHKITPPADTNFWVQLIVFASFILLIYLALSTHKLNRN